MTTAFTSSARALSLVTKPPSQIIYTLYAVPRPLSLRHDLLTPVVYTCSTRTYATNPTPRKESNLKPNKFATKTGTSKDVTTTTTNTTTKAVTNTSPTTSTDIELYGDGINPPLTTLPPPLSIPERSPDVSTPVYWYRVGRAYGKFYVTGVKQTYWNYKKAKGLRREIHKRNSSSSSSSEGEENYPPRRWLGLVPPPLLLDIEVFMRKEQGFSRSQFQLLAREREDVKKLPLFAILVAVFGEWLPLIVPFIPGRVPKTCRIPKQVKGMREASEARRKESFRKGIFPPGGAVMEAIRQRVENARRIEEGLKVEAKRKSGEEEIEADLDADEAGDLMALRTQPANWLAVEITQALTRPQLAHVSASFGLHGKIWDRLGVVGGEAPLTALLKMRVAKKLHYLNLDDELLVKEKNKDFRALSGQEVEIACEDRGIDVTNKKEEQLRKDLAKWLDGRAKDGGYGEEITKMLFKRPNSW